MLAAAMLEAKRTDLTALGDSNLLGGDVLVLNAAVDERSQGGGSVLDAGGLLGDGELLHELVKNLDGSSVLGHFDGFGYYVEFSGGVSKSVVGEVLESKPRDLKRSTKVYDSMGARVVVVEKRPAVRTMEGRLSALSWLSWRRDFSSSSGGG